MTGFENCPSLERYAAEQARNAPREPRRCASCGVYTYNAEHICIEYDASRPCETCGAPTVGVTIAAPGTGSGRSCPAGHYHGTCRELTLAEVR